MSRNRDFNFLALDEVANPKLKANWSPGFFSHGSLWQFRIFLPRWLVRGPAEEEICTAGDQDLLQTVFERDFGGYTAGLSFLRGVGYRGTELETNLHAELIVLASRWRGTMRYFRALRKELQECSGEEQVLIFRQELVVV